jgi:hypothetical protein
MRILRTLLASVALTALGVAQSYTNYTSPYFYVPAVTAPALTPDFNVLPRSLSNSNHWSNTAYNNWTNFNVIQGLDTTWGPYYINFPAPPVLKTDVAWGQLRLLAAANRIRGIVPYAHHHMHVWNVPNTPQWITNKYTPGVGIDCSDFTHWIYSYGLGIKLLTGVSAQGAMTNAVAYFANGKTNVYIPTRLFDVQHGYTKKFHNLATNLQPGDLLYIRSNPGTNNPVSHVIMWLGNLAYDTNHVDKWLVTDSHGQVVYDSATNLIPSGPQIRPFRETNYYYNCFDHVLRYLPLTQ